MNHITFSSIIYFAELILLAVLILGIAAWKLGGLFYKYDQRMKEREKQFELTFIKTQFILTLDPTEKRMNELLTLVAKLEKWSNKEKVNMVKTKFFADYKKLSDEILSEEEYSVNEVFRKN